VTVLGEGNGPIDAFVHARVGQGHLAPSSAAVIRSVLRHWTAFAGDDPRLWTEALVMMWVNDPGLRPATRKSRLTKLRPYVRWLMDRGHLDRDLTADIGRIRIPEGPPRDFTPAEVAQLLHACPDTRAQLIVILMAQLGLRCGDVARIRVEDIDARGRSLHVRAKGGRGDYTHWVPIPLEAWSAIAAWLNATGSTSGPLVPSYQRPGQPLDPAHISKLVGRWIVDAGLKAFPGDGRSAHSLRHSCAQHMLDAGADLRQVQRALGHTTIRSTEVYTRPIAACTEA